MSLEENKKQIKELEYMRNQYPQGKEYDELTQQIKELKTKTYQNLSAYDRVTLARSPQRGKAIDFIEGLFDHFYELHGDRCFQDDQALLGGIAYFHDIPVTVLAQSKGKNVQENLKRHFGMCNPEGYRKAMRLAKQAEKFKRPIITFVDTAGAYPGIEAEERGQAQAIGECLSLFANIKTPVICVVISEGGSGGALALSIGDRIVMLENAVYSILSPEGFASILWKDETRAQEAAQLMQLTSYDLKNKGIVDYLLKEPLGGIDDDLSLVLHHLDQYLLNELKILMSLKESELLKNRYDKYRRIGM